MRMRIIAGRYGGRLIAAPNTSATHPMSERARGAIFNRLGADIRGARVLDAFAGSGAVGFEALSRGADHITFIEQHRVAARVIRENSQLLQTDDACVVINTTVNNWLSTSSPEGFDLIFADPPYHNPQFSTAKKLLGLLKVGGYMVLSHTGKGGTLDRTGIVVVDNRSYGNACITFYHREF